MTTSILGRVPDVCLKYEPNQHAGDCDDGIVVSTESVKQGGDSSIMLYSRKEIFNKLKMAIELPIEFVKHAGIMDTT